MRSPASDTFPFTFLPYRGWLTIRSTGVGTFEGGGTLVLGGQLAPMEYKNGTNHVGPDCRGTAKFETTFQPGTWDEALVVFNQGKDMISTTTSPTGEIDICRFTRMDQAPGTRAIAPIHQPRTARD